MLRRISVSTFLIASFLWIASVSSALEEATTGFYYPLNSFSYSNSGYWLGPGLGSAGPNGHIGVDMLAPEGAPVYAIADGVIYDISENGWGDGNVAVLVKHYISDGRWFIAVYGHLEVSSVSLRKGNNVQAGKTVIGRLGAYFTEPHLHFGVAYPERLPGPTYGYSSTENHNNFVNPTIFLEKNRPKSLFYRLVSDVDVYGQIIALYWTPADVSCKNAQKWCYDPNGRVSSAELCSSGFTPAICDTVYDRLAGISYKYSLPDWIGTFFADDVSTLTGKCE